MSVSNHHLDELIECGYTIVEGFLTPEELKDAQDALWQVFPHPEKYFVDPSKYPHYGASPWAGLRNGPWPAWALNRLTFHPDLVDLAERFLGTSDLHLYKTQLWAKYGGGADYAQAHHRDFDNHSIVVPRRSDPRRQMTSWILLSDVADEDGPTKVVPYDLGKDVPYWPNHLQKAEMFGVEVSATGPAGTLFSYRTDTLHRGSAVTGDCRSRFVLAADYQGWDQRWIGKMAWPDHTSNPGWNEMIERATPRERLLFGFPAPGDPYWDGQTISDVHARYPNMNMAPYLPR